MTAYIFGHKSPDTDTVTSAISLAYMKNQMGEKATPVVLGDLNPETKFVLDKFGVAAPEVMESVAGKDVYLVDTSDKAQLPADIAEANILGIYDHHKLGDVTTPQPIEAFLMPVGCTGTVLKAMYDFNSVEIPKDIAGIMLCAIISDTVIFKSATCTQKDIDACEDLAKIADVSDMQTLGMDMFKVKSAVDGTPVRELVLRDYKDFDMNGTALGVGQLEVVDLSILDGVKADLEKDIQTLKEEKGHHTVLLMLTDIIKEGTELLVATDDASIVEKAFNCKIENGKTWLDGVMSRKKQVVPFLEKILG